MIQPDAANAHVLLVEDDEPLRRALMRAIRLSGLDVEAFASAEMLLARGIPGGRVCLVLDINLPGMSGIELARRLLAAGDEVPTILITALDCDFGSAVADLRPAGVLRKPFATAALLASIRSAMQ